MIRLTDLGRLVARTEKGWRLVETVAEADGLELLCPKCWTANAGPVGTHHVLCWSPSVPLDVAPGPGRWNLVGTTIDDLSLVAGSSSVALQGDCNAHFFVKAGEIELLPS